MTRRTSLAATLRSFSAATGQEEAYRLSMLELLAGPADPFTRKHFTPGHFTTSAFVVSPDEQDILLIHHRKLNLWIQPGGHMDPDDSSPELSARREVAEEVGLPELLALHQGLFDVDVHAIPALKGEDAHKHFDLRYLFRSPTRELSTNHEVKGARWVPLSQVNSYGTDASVLRAVHKISARR